MFCEQEEGALLNAFKWFVVLISTYKIRISESGSNTTRSAKVLRCKMVKLSTKYLPLRAKYKDARMQDPIVRRFEEIGRLEEKFIIQMWASYS